MSTLLTARDLSKAFASGTLFTDVSVQLVERDRLGLIGPNGAGKSTLLKILAGLESPDAGEVTRRRGLRQVYVPQDDDFEPEASVRAIVIDRVDDLPDDRLDPATRAEITLSKLGFTDFDQLVGTLSGGWRKRLAIAGALVREPDVLLLDEPTNHLDLDGVLWLEQFVRQARIAIAFITHDRRFLENVASRIIELAPSYPGGTFEVAGNYSEFVRRKEAFLDGQAAAESALANSVRRDTAWLRQGVQARRTRNQSTVAAVEARRSEFEAVRGRNEAPNRTTAIDFQATERKTNKLLALHGVSKSIGGRLLFDGLELLLSPGRRLGLLGANGTGKTTLLRLMSGELEPDTGTIKGAHGLRVVMFTQHREDLVPTQTLQEALCPIGDTVDYRGKPIHVTGWAKKFLFAPTQLSTLVANLSGGERARVLLAQLMLRPADVLLLDEPTNDLDIPSLEVLEQALLEFPGALVLVTHDRFMLERISTELLAIDGPEGARVYASIDQWQAARTRAETERRAATTGTGAGAGIDRSSGAASSARPKARKITYKEQIELAAMEATILEAESKAATLEATIADPAIIADHLRYAAACTELDAAHRAVQTLYDRWAELDTLQRGVDG